MSSYITTRSPSNPPGQLGGSHCRTKLKKEKQVDLELRLLISKIGLRFGQFDVSHRILLLDNENVNLDKTQNVFMPTVS